MKLIHCFLMILSRKSIAQLLLGFFLVGVFIVSTDGGFANMVGTETQNFNATASAKDYVTVYSSKTLGAGNYSLGLFINSAMNTLPYFDESADSAKRSGYNDSLTAAEAAMAYGVLSWLDVGLNLPAVLHQDIREKDKRHGEFNKRGITEARLSAKARVFKNDLVGLAAIVSANLDQTEDNPYQGKDASPTANAEIAADINIGRDLSLAANIGYRFKNAGRRLSEDTPIEPYKDQFIYSAAAAYSVTRDSQIMFETFASAPMKRTDDDSERHLTRAESIIGMKILGDHQLVYNFGAGTELRHSVSSADLRLYGGLSWLVESASASRKRVSQRKEIESSRRAPSSSVVLDQKPDEVIVLSDVFFKFDSAELREGQDYSKLRQVATKLREKGFERLVVEGHTCSLGNSTYNKNLSRRRADRIKSLLIERFRLDGSRIQSLGKGESLPIASNSNENGRKKNRRVEFKIYRENLSYVN